MDMEDLVALLNDMPFTSRLGVEVLEAADGHARARLRMVDWHSSTEVGRVAHGGVTYSLADTAGGAAVMSLNRPPCPTVDMRIDYLSPATGDLVATAEVIRDGGSLSTVEIAVAGEDGEPVARAHGVYKTDGADGTTAWEE